jgi:RHS repeat-associated protein
MKKSLFSKVCHGILSLSLFSLAIRSTVPISAQQKTHYWFGNTYFVTCEITAVNATSLGTGNVEWSSVWADQTIANEPNVGPPVRYVCAGDQVWVTCTALCDACPGDPNGTWSVTRDPNTLATINVVWGGNPIGFYLSAPADPTVLPYTVCITNTLAGAYDFPNEGGDCQGPLTFQAVATIVFTNPTCSCSPSYCRGKPYGGSSVDDNSVDCKISLGNPSPRYDGGMLWLKATVPSTNLSTPSLLQVPWLMPNVTILTNTNGSIQQVYTPQGLLNVHTLSVYEYHVECFYASNVTGPTGGFYGTNAPAYATHIFKNPDGAADYTNLWIIDEELSGNYTNKFTYLTTNGEWQLLEPDGQTTLLTWRVQNTTNAAITNLYKTVSVGSNILSQATWTLQYVPLITNSVLLQVVDGVAPTTRTTTYTYSTNATQSNLVQSVTYPNGSWKYYQYDSMGRKTNEYNAYGNSTLPSGGAPPNPATTSCKNIQYYYTLGGFDVDSNNFLSPMETIVSIPSSSGTLTEVSRQYHITQVTNGYDWLYQCPNPGAAWNDPSNFYTFTQTAVASDITGGLPLYVLHPNGTETTYQYIYDTNSLTTLESDPDGSITTNVVDAFGNTQSITKIDAATGVVLSSNGYTYTDPLERSYNTVDLAGRTTSYTYDCCNLDTLVDSDCSTNQNSFDVLRRRVATSIYYGGRGSITTTNKLDGVGRVLQTQRIGTDGSLMTLQQSGYDILGRVITQTNALGAVTQTSYSGDGVPLSVTNVYPDGGTRIETYYADGRLQSVTGNAVAPVQYNYGLAQDGGTNREYTQTIKLNSSGGTNEWSETFADGMGHAYKKLYATATGSNPIEQSIYNFSAIAQTADADGVTAMYQYYTNSGNINTGKMIFATNDPSNSVRVTQVAQAVMTSGIRGHRVTSTNYQYLSATGTAVSSSETSANGLTNWNSSYPDGVTPVTTVRVTSPGRTRTETVTAPDGSYTISVYSCGRLASVTQYASSGTQIGQTTYGYDAHGRRVTVTDTRNGTTTYTFNNADAVTAVTTPNPQSIGGSPETTTTYYDAMMRPTNIVYPEGGSLTNVYYHTGQLQLTYGSRAYPVGYSYDAQGRKLSMTNWTNFATSGGTRVTTWSYDTYRGFLTNKTDAAGNSVSYTYTPAGRLASRIWARGTNATYSYNTAGDLATVIYSDTTPGITNTYDRLGRKTSVVCGGTTTTFVYNWANDVLSESYSGGILNGVIVTNQFDSCLRRTNMTLMNGSTVLCQTTNGYDGASRLAVVSDGTNSAIYSYLANSSLVGQITFQQSGATRMTTSKQYDYLNRLTSISSTPSNSFVYLYNSADQRTMVRLADSGYWQYGYDSLGQLIQGNKYWVDETPVAGQQFDYSFDTIGNRIETKAGGDQNGANLRLAYYTNNVLNQITSRTVPGDVDVMGIGIATNTVTVNGQTAYRKNEYFRDQLSVTNSTNAVWDSITVTNNGSSANGHSYVAETPENYTYDADGNLLSDGRWNYEWDGENRLLSMTSLSGAPSGSLLQLQFTYDYLGRRMQKTVFTNNGTNYIGEYTNVYAYDGWNCIAILNPFLSLSNSLMWGTDLSGSLHGAGGVGGLVKVSYYGATTTNCFVACDGNGNASALISAADGSTAANYEYGPFGELIRCSGAMSKLNPFRFSTKYGDDESDFLFFGYRYYNPSIGRWLNRDSIEESGGLHLYLFVDNRPQTRIDLLGHGSLSYSTINNSIPQPLVDGKFTPWIIGWIAYGGDLPDPGRVVQAVNWEIWATTCGNCELGTGGDELTQEQIWNQFGYSGPIRMEYNEAWPLHDTVGATYADTWQVPPVNNTFYNNPTTGKILIRAGAGYYPLSTLSAEDGWGVGGGAANLSSPMSGELPSTIRAINMQPYGGPSTILYRTLEVTWNACCSSKGQPGNTHVSYGYVGNPPPGGGTQAFTPIQ